MITLILWLALTVIALTPGEPEGCVLEILEDGSTQSNCDITEPPYKQP